YIMRHGQTDMNISGKMQGHIDCPLNDTGRKQAAAAAEIIRKHQLSFDRVITSHLGRTKETAEIALGIPRTEFETDDRLIEIDYGEWDGKTYEEMGPEMHEFLQDPVNIHAPEGIEPLEDVTRRVGEFLTDLLQNAGPQDKILAVSHGVAIRAMFGWIRNLERPGNEIWRMPVDNCAIFRTEIKDGKYSDPELLR
ncbi:MAG: histidine phosphatase family protein, partial [Eubacterium sp.]